MMAVPLQSTDAELDARRREAATWVDALQRSEAIDRNAAWPAAMRSASRLLFVRWLVQRGTYSDQIERTNDE